MAGGRREGFRHVYTDYQFMFEFSRWHSFALSLSSVPLPDLCIRGNHKLIVGQDTGLQAEDSRDS